MKYKNIVCFGGGNVVPKLLLEPLKKYPVKITGITSMVDNGGSTGQLRKDFNVLPPGDIRRHILALSNAPKYKKEIWNFRFGQEKFPGGHKGHNFANVFIGGLEYYIKDYSKVLEIVHQFMEVKKHQALPATIDDTQIIAILENKKIIIGEDEIDVPQKHNPKLKIKKVFLKPKAKAYKRSLDAIKKANLIVFGPGDLYSSIIACVLPIGMKQAFKQTKAKKTLIVNPLTKNGETNNFSVKDLANETEKYIGCKLDYVIYNNFIPDKQRIKKYKKQRPELLELTKIDSDLPKKKPALHRACSGTEFIGKNLLLKTGPIEYDPKKLTKIILNKC